MNILHYFLGLPPLHSGGLMIYARDLAKEQMRSGHIVIMLMPGKYKANSNKSTIKYFGNTEGITIYQILNGLPFSDIGINEPQQFMHPVPNNNYEDFLKQNKIDIVHIHSLIGLPREFIETVKLLNIKSIYTSHDYFALCPTIYLFNTKDEHCCDYKNGFNCVDCNLLIDNETVIMNRNKLLGFVYKMLSSLNRVLFVRKAYRYVKEIVAKKSNNDTTKKKNYNVESHVNTSCNTVNKNLVASFKKLRDYHIDMLNKIDVIIFNSSVAMNVYSKYLELDNKKNYILAVTHGNINDNRKSMTVDNLDDKIHFAYMGYLDKKKGFIDLLEVLRKIKLNYNNWDITIYGDISHVNINEYCCENYVFSGSYNHDELPDIFKKSDMLIMPSKWKETFGFIGLEAMSFGVPVLVSNNVGYSDLVNSNVDGIVYNDDKYNKSLYNSIIDILENPSILKNFKENLLRRDFTFGMSEHAYIMSKIYES